MLYILESHQRHRHII